MRIVLIDSGIGGLNTLNECKKIAEDIEYIYFADSQYAPYGNLKSEVLLERLCSIINSFVGQDINAVILACNTASSVCLEYLQQKFDIPIFGVSPDIDNAVSSGDKTLLLCTYLTSKSKIVEQAKAKYDNLTVLALPELATMIENSNGDYKQCYQYLIKKLEMYSNYQSLIIGCTHYFYVMRSIIKILPDIKIFGCHRGLDKFLLNLHKN